jgi:hypothetical protein
MGSQAVTTPRSQHGQDTMRTNVSNISFRHMPSRKENIPYGSKSLVMGYSGLG